MRISFVVALLLGFVGCGQALDTPRVDSNSSEPLTTADNEHESTENESKPNLESDSKGSSAQAKTPAPAAIDVEAFLNSALDGKIETIRTAIDAGIDVNATGEQRRTALMMASFNSHNSIVKLLLKNGAKVDQRDMSGRTALLFAATGKDEDTVEILLDAGADVNSTDTLEQFTALMHAAAEGQIKVVQVLLDRKADTRVRDKDGDTARDFAVQNGHADVVRMLTE